MSIKLGFGSAKVIVEKESKLPVDKIETEILISEDLARLVLQKKMIEKKLNIEPGELSLMMDSILDQLEPEIEEVVDQKRAQPNSLTGDSKPDSVRVNVGSHETINEGETVEEVVVVGGKLDVYGEVKELVVMGGQVTLHPTAVISRELVILGGDIETMKGARVEGSNVQLNFSLLNKGLPYFWKHIVEADWDHNKFTESISIYWILFQWLFLLLIFWIEKTFAPLFKSRVQKKLEHSVLMASLWGFGFSIIHVPLTVLLTVSLIGIPLIPVYYCISFVFYMVGIVNIARFIASKLLQDSFMVFAAILAGLLSLNVLPGLGFPLKAIAFIAGYGAVVKVFIEGILAAKPSTVIS